MQTRKKILNMLQQMKNGHNCTRNRLKLANAMHTCRPQGNEKRKLRVCLLKFKGFAARGCPYCIFTRCIIKAVRRQSVWPLHCRLQMLMCKSYYSWCSSQHRNRSPASSQISRLTAQQKPRIIYTPLDGHSTFHSQTFLSLRTIMEKIMQNFQKLVLE